MAPIPDENPSAVPPPPDATTTAHSADASAPAAPVSEVVAGATVPPPEASPPVAPAPPALSEREQSMATYLQNLQERGEPQCPVCRHALVRSLVPGDYPRTPTGPWVCSFDTTHDVGPALS